MVIRIFFLGMLFLATLSYFIPVNNKKVDDNIDDIALLTFDDATMYTLTTESMNRIIYTKKAVRYKTKDMMYDGALTLKSKDKANNQITDVLYADLIIKRGDNFKFINNVKYKRDDYITLYTNELVYNAKNKIATNSVPFNGTYYNNSLSGEKIYLNLNKYHLKADNTHFEINIK
ncbi:MAG: hypothetical protein ACNI25_05040 [Halarcobacter sp.]